MGRFRQSLLRGKRAVLAGDHKQLPPTIKCSVREVQRELGRTLFERLIVAYEKDGEDSCHRSKMLEVQYRMHQSELFILDTNTCFSCLSSRRPANHSLLLLTPCKASATGRAMPCITES